MAPSRGSKNSQRCTMSRFLPERETCPSSTLRSADLCLCSLHVLQSDNLNCRLGREHTFAYTFHEILLTISYEGFTQSRFDRLDHVKGLVMRLHTLHRLYRSTRQEDILPGLCWFDTSDRHPWLVSD